MPEVTLLPILYATITATFFGTQVVLTMRTLRYVDPPTSSMICMGTCVRIFSLPAPSISLRVFGLQRMENIDNRSQVMSYCSG